MKVWAAKRFCKDDVHGDQLTEFKLFKTEAKAQVFVSKEPETFDFYYIVDEYEVEQ